MNHRPFNLNSTSVAASMEGFGSSTGAIRNKKNEWLSSQKSGIFAKVVATVAAIGLVSLAVVFAVPIIKKSLSHNVPVSHALNHHNQAHNGTFGKRQAFYSNYIIHFRSIWIGRNVKVIWI